MFNNICSYVFGKDVVEKMKSIKIILLIIILISLVACSNKETFIDVDDKNCKYIALESPYYYNLNTNEIRSIETTPMDDMILYFIQGNYAFFSNNENHQGLNLSVLNLDTYENKNVYRSGNLYDYDGLLGLDMLFPKLSESEYNSQLIRLNNNSWFYNNCIYSFKKKHLQSLNLNNNEISFVYEQLNISDVLRKEENIYIIDTENNLYISNMDCTNLELLCKNFSCDNFLLYDKLVFYITYEDASKIYKLGTETPFFVCNSNLSLKYITADYLIVWNEADDSLYYSTHDKANFKQISINPQAEIVYADSEYIYFFTGESVFLMDYTGEVIKKTSVLNNLSVE